MRINNSQKIFSENVIQIILTSQELARSENSQSVELHHILRGLIHHKKSSAGVILNRFKIIRVEDGFIRSVGLGGDLFSPKLKFLF